MHLQRPSIERLIREAVRDRLLNDYVLGPGVVQLHFENADYELDPEQARCFLLGVLFGFHRVLQTEPEAPVMQLITSEAN